MKLISYILAFYIGVLIIQPTFIAFANKVQTEIEEVCDNDCCSEEQSCDGESDNSGGCCPGGICNPFESCSCCFGFSISRPSVELTINTVCTDYIQVAVKEVHYGYSADCFHPPELFYRIS